MIETPDTTNRADALRDFEQFLREHEFQWVENFTDGQGQSIAKWLHVPSGVLVLIERMREGFEVYGQFARTRSIEGTKTAIANTLFMHALKG